MNASASALPEPMAVAASSVPPTRAFYWSVRRELWEKRSLYIAPLALAGLIVLAMAIGAISGNGISISASEAQQISGERLRGVAVGVFAILAMLMSFNMAIVAFFYTLDALHGERKDRSVLFWKSLPVSDTSTVLSKAFTSAVAAPAIGFVVLIALYVATLVVGAVALAANGGSGFALLANSELIELILLGLYVIVVGALWYAPVTAWLLFVSSWARRTPFLWAVLPIGGLVVVEYFAFGTWRIRDAIGQRLSDSSAFDSLAGMSFGSERLTHASPKQLPDGSVLSIIDPVQFFSQPALWVGLAIAAGLVAASIWMRRYREPL
jgi:ABC-2 type transport system permease protein